MTEGKSKRHGFENKKQGFQTDPVQNSSGPTVFSNLVCFN